MTIYSEEIYPSQLEVARAIIFVQFNGKMLPGGMPVIIFSWCDDVIIKAMSHQSLQ